MALHTRVIMKVFHPQFGFVERTADRGAAFRDQADIQRVMNEMRSTVPKGRKIVFDTREAG